MHIQNATLAGGVGIGSVADMLIGPWAALLVGFIAGTISVAGYKFLTVSLFLSHSSRANCSRYCIMHIIRITVHVNTIMIIVIISLLFQPLLEKIHLQDTCGVHNLHGTPGILSAIASAIAAGVASSSGSKNRVDYGSRSV